MLSDEEIEVLVKKGILKEKSAYEKKGKRRLYFVKKKMGVKINLTEENWEDKLHAAFRIYFLNSIEDDLKIQKFIDEGIESQIERLFFEDKQKVKNLLNISLPSKEARLKNLEKFHEEFSTKLEREIKSDWQYSYLTVEDLIDKKKKFFYSRLNYIMTYDSKSEQVVFEFKLEYPDSDIAEDKEDFNSETMQISYLKILQWINEQILIETEKNNKPQETLQNGSNNSLSHKQQILLLEKLGVFEIAEIKKLTGLQKGKLFSILLNRNEKNTTDYIRNKDVRKGLVSMDKDFVKSDSNVKRVSEILKEIGLEK